MIKLKPDTWYYLYRNSDEISISDTAPFRDNQEKGWIHPIEKNFRCINTIRTPSIVEPEIVKFKGTCNGNTD